LTISFCTVVFDETWELERLLKHVKPYVDEVVVGVVVTEFGREISVPSESFDIAYRYADKVVRLDFENYSQIRNDLIEECSGDWILMLDPDELLDQSVLDALGDLTAKQDIEGVVFLRRNYEVDEYDRLLTGVNYPDPQLRLFRSYARWVGNVHEKLTNVEKLVAFKAGHLIHIKVLESKDRRIRKAKLYSKLAKSKRGSVEITKKIPLRSVKEV